jgi:hypothetical protein
MSFQQYVADEKYKLIANGAIAAIGFFVALFANSCVDDWKEKRAVATMLSALQAEARSNEVALQESFLPLYETGLVFREFGTTAVSQALANSSFVKHSSVSRLEMLAQYLRDVSLANAYRGKAEAIRFSDGYFKKSSDQSIKSWERPLVNAWGANLNQCQKSIAEVLSVK